MSWMEDKGQALHAEVLEDRHESDGFVPVEKIRQEGGRRRCSHPRFVPPEERVQRTDDD